MRTFATRKLIRPPVLLAALCAAALCGCGPKYNRVVPKELLEKLPYESRIELLEAENDLAVVDDKVEEAHNEVQRTRDSIRRAKSRRDAAGHELGEAKDEPSREVAQLAIEESEARVEWLRTRQELNVRNAEAEELALRCAYARLSVARLAIARKNKIQGSEKLNPADFDQQVKDCDAELTAMRNSIKEQEKKAEVVRTSWEGKKTALARKTFDARASPYVE